MKMHGSIRYLTTLVGCLAFIAIQADAKPGKGNSSGKGKSSHSQKAKKDKKHDNAKHDHAGKKNDNDDKHDSYKQFTRYKDSERSEVVTYFSRYRNQGDGLPPGLAMNRRRGKALPPGWQSRLVPGYRISDTEWPSYGQVPSEWFPKLRMEPNTRLYHYGDRVVRVYEPRREVIEVITLSSGR